MAGDELQGILQDIHDPTNHALRINGPYAPLAHHAQHEMAGTDALTSFTPLAQGVKVVGFGDSITIRDGDNVNNIWGQTYLSYAVLASGGRLKYVFNAGVAGDQTSQMLARIQTDVIAKAPDLCLVMGGTNDNQKITVAASLANIATIVNTLRAAKIEPVLLTIPPNTGSGLSAQAVAAQRRWVVAFNAGLRTYANTNGVRMVDAYAILVDPSTGGYRTSLGNSDGVHPTAAGSKALGVAIAKALTGGGGFKFESPFLLNDDANPFSPVRGVFNAIGSGLPAASGWFETGGTGSTTTTEPYFLQSATVVTNTSSTWAATGTYYYVIVALDAYGNPLAVSNERSAVIAATTNQAALSWSAVTGALGGYQVYRGAATDAYTVLVTTVAAGTTTYVDTGTAGTPARAPECSEVNPINGNWLRMDKTTNDLHIIQRDMPIAATTLASSVAANATSMSVTATIGSRNLLWIGTPGSATFEAVVRDGSGASGSGPYTVTLATPLRYAHNSAEPVVVTADPGDLIAFFGIIDTTGLSAGAPEATPAVVGTNLLCTGHAGGTPGYIASISLNRDVSRGGFYTEQVLPAGTTTMSAQCTVNSVQSGTVTGRWAQLGVVNLTKMALITKEL